MNWVCFNGKLYVANEPVLPADNRGYRYGDGLFETLKIRDGKILLASLHFDRLQKGLALLNIRLPGHSTVQRLQEEILHLASKNQCENHARVRLTVTRGRGGLYDGNPPGDFLIECWPLDTMVGLLNTNGLVMGVYPDARKPCDRFSSLKSTSFQPYALAALYAKEQQWNDALLLNSNGCIADSTIANLFLFKKGMLFTPALSEGCIDGVMRRYLLTALRDSGTTVEETRIHPEELLDAEELFLTNAIRGIRWVQRLDDRLYGNTQTTAIYNRFIRTIPG